MTIARKSLLGLLTVGGLLTVYTYADRAFLHPQPATAPGSSEQPARGTGENSTGTLWRQLSTEMNSGLSESLSTPGLQLFLAFLAGASVGGSSIYRLYPRLQRAREARRIRAAERRQRLRLADEELLANAAAERVDAG